MDSKLKEISIENNIIILYFIILLLYLYANSVEIKYFDSGFSLYKDEYRILLYIVFGMYFIISLYYVLSSFTVKTNIIH